MEMGTRALGWRFGRLCSLRKLHLSMKEPSGSNPVMNKYSRTITEPASQGASQAMLYATGLKPENICLPQVGVLLFPIFHFLTFHAFSFLGGDMFCLVRRKSMQHAFARSVSISKDGCGGCWAGWLQIQHYRSERWDQHGHRRYVVFPAVTGPDCRLDRNSNECSVVRLMLHVYIGQ